MVRANQILKNDSVESRIPMFFASDNWAGAHPAIAESLMKASTGFVPAYGASPLDKAVEKQFNEVFEREVSVFFVSTGTAANSLSLASVARTGGVVFCHSEAHIMADEAGAPEFFTGSARLAPVSGADGKMDPKNLTEIIARYPAAFIHHGQPMAISLTQATEAGTVYSLDEISAISAIAKEQQLPLHMDGARFANALVSLGCSPAEMTWKRGVDLLSFGGTKNGCWCAEAIVCFDPAKAKDLPYIRKRSAQLFSKSRFVAAQFNAYLENDRWLDFARHANGMADALRLAIANAPRAQLAWETTANEVFMILPSALSDSLRAEGAVFYDWPIPSADVAARMQPGDNLVRLVTSYATMSGEIDAFSRSLVRD